MKYAILTFGCKVNQYESTAIENAMNAAGFEPSGDPETADIVIVNSCSVTENGDRKARRAVAAAKKRCPAPVVVLTGCYVQAYPAAAAQTGADIITGSARRAEIPSLIQQLTEGKRVQPDLTLPDEFEEPGILQTTAKTRAFIKVEDGCDRYCSYCIIPYARGKVRSRSLPSIEREAGLCAADGHKEIVLVGINLSRYGTDIGCDLADAVNAAAKPGGILRVRLSSLEPELLDERTVSRLAENPKLCPHFHLSLQSGCDATLRRMNRHYTTAEYLAIVERLRRSFPDCAITTDVMVGFAGETEDEFEQSLAFVQSVGFARIHVFSYSVRSGTAAAKRTDHIAKDVKQERYARMSAIAGDAARAFLAAHIGKKYDIIVQKRTSPDYASGLTPNYIPVRVYGSDAQKHDILHIKITSSADEYCTGTENA